MLIASDSFLSSDKMMNAVKVFVPVASRFVRPRTNTDWNYAAKSLPLLSHYCSELSIVTQTSVVADAIINFRYMLSIARKLRVLKVIPPSLTYSLGQYSPVFASDLRNRNFQAILSYERFPSRSFGLPVVWITSPTNIERQQKEGVPAARTQQLKDWKWHCAENASKLIFTTQAYLEEFLTQSSESLRSKSVVIPFFLPSLTADPQITGKWQNNDEWNLLFVGRQARRKGLVETLEALTPLLKDDKRVTFTILSPLADGPVSIPDLPNIRVVPEASREEVLQWMSRSHLLVMPSSWESYGFVYIEAMSRGCVPLAVDRPVQRELLGGNGILVASQDAGQIRDAISEALCDRETLYRSAQGGLRDFRARHSPEAIAGNFHQTLMSAAELNSKKTFA